MAVHVVVLEAELVEGGHVSPLGDVHVALHVHPAEAVQLQVARDDAAWLLARPRRCEGAKPAQLILVMSDWPATRQHTMLRGTRALATKLLWY